MNRRWSEEKQELRERVERALHEAHGVRAVAARKLGVSRVSLYKYMRVFGIAQATQDKAVRRCEVKRYRLPPVARFVEVVSRVRAERGIRGG